MVRRLHVEADVVELPDVDIVDEVPVLPAIPCDVYAAVTAGENVVYIGYYRWSVIYGSSITLELATSLR